MAYRSFGALIGWQAAVERIRNSAPILPSEIVPLQDAPGRILRDRVLADRDQPPFDRITMDGYALRSADLSRPAALLLKGQLFAGDEAAISVGPGECVRVFTGSRLPGGADCVVAQEEAHKEGDRILFTAPARAGQNVTFTGLEARRGDVLLSPGQKLTPAAMAMLGSVGHLQVAVTTLPRVQILITGDEIVSPEAVPTALQERASNALLLRCALRERGIPAGYTLLGDDPELLKAQIEAFLEQGTDLLLCTGGVSVGDRDFVAQLLKECGFAEVFHGVNLKPGKPLFFGARAEAQVLAFPGNPFAVHVGIRIFLEAWLRKALGQAAEEPIYLPMGESRRRKTDRVECFPARLDVCEGFSQVLYAQHTGSGSLRAGLSPSLAMQEEPELLPGMPVAFWPSG